MSDLFRDLKATEQCYRKRRVLITGIKVYISALRLDDGELLILASPQFNALAVQDYALRWEIETLFSCLKGRGFNLEDTRLTDPSRVKKLVAVLAVGFCWSYLTGEWRHDVVKPIRIKNHGRLSQSVFRYGLDFVQMAIQQLMVLKNKENFMQILAVLRGKYGEKNLKL